MFFLIALLPALSVFYIAAISKSRAKTTVAALLAAAVGVLTGNPAYMALDLLFVVVAYGVSMWGVGSGTGGKASPVASKSEPVVARGDSDPGTTLGILGGLGFLAYLIFGSGSNHGPANKSPPAVVAKPPAAIPANLYVPALPKPTQLPAVVSAQPKRPPKSPLQRCLEIKSDDKMAKCLETLD